MRVSIGLLAQETENARREKKILPDTYEVGSKLVETIGHITIEHIQSAFIADRNQALLHLEKPPPPQDSDRLLWSPEAIASLRFNSIFFHPDFANVCSRVFNSPGSQSHCKK